ncbi:MAG: class I fructose-bisphosphate aldolase [Tannerellaceae bacterium]|jgi:class I fructose-bisphosphate aldolase|nr:class I fructose-bisphosphate aldolase [Tannerellaceae bacterium]
MIASKVVDLLGPEADYYLTHTCRTISKLHLHIPSPHFADEVWIPSDRNIATLKSLRAMFGHGRLAGTGYLSVLLAGQGVEYTAGSSFAANPLYFDPENILRLAIEGGCSALASTFGVLGMTARKYAGRIPFIVKLNHNELLTCPRSHAQMSFGTVKEAWNMGATAIGASVYFGSEEGQQTISDVADAFQYAHELGMATVLWCYLQNDNFHKDETDYHTAADLTGQANHLGASMQADIVVQKLPLVNGGFPALNYAPYSHTTYAELTTGHPIDLCRYQVANGYMGRVGLISSDNNPQGHFTVRDTLLAAIVNKRAGGMGLAGGTAIFQRPLKEGVEILHAIQDIYREPEITIA